MALVLDGSGTITGATTLASTVASPVFTAPALGTPASGNLASCTGYPTATSAEIKTGTVSTKFIAPDALLAAQGFTARYNSGNQTITTAGALTLTHSLGREPILVTSWIKCLTGDGAYSIGDKLLVPGSISNSTADNKGYSIVSGSTTLSVRFGGNATVFGVLNKTTGAGVDLTNASWAFVVEAFA